MGSFVIYILRVIKSRRMKWARLERSMGQMRKSYKILFGIPKGKLSFGRPWGTWEDNFKIYLKETGLKLKRIRKSPVADSVMNLSWSRNHLPFVKSEIFRTAHHWTLY
jgi:hypothetical protein